MLKKHIFLKFNNARRQRTQIQTTVKLHFIPIRLAKTTTPLEVGSDVAQQEFSYGPRKTTLKYNWATPIITR